MRVKEWKGGEFKRKNEVDDVADKISLYIYKVFMGSIVIRCGMLIVYTSQFYIGSKVCLNICSGVSGGGKKGNLIQR